MDSLSSYLEDNNDGEGIAGLIPLASVSQQPYVSELLSFTLDRLHKVFFLINKFCLFFFIHFSPFFSRSDLSHIFPLLPFRRNRSFFESMRRGFVGRCRKLRWLITVLLYLLLMLWFPSEKKFPPLIIILNPW